MKSIILNLIIVGVICFFPQPLSAQNLPAVYHTKNSREWYFRNSHLIPNQQELDAILKLDFDGDGIITASDGDIDGDGIFNFEDSDIDGDGIDNELDPSPYDWREAGYNPFAVLGFLSWNHNWNNFKYNEENLDQAVELLKGMGCAFVRTDFYWNDIEPVQGKFCFDKYDHLVDLLSENNIRILGILDYSADWAASSWNSPPYNDDDFVNYCRKVVSRYKNKIKYWEIWNEPDSKFYWQPQDNMKRYSQLLRKVYLCIKEVDPSAQVLMGGLTQNGYYALQDLYRQGGGEYFDIVNMHPFVNPLTSNPKKEMESFYRKIKKLMSKFGDGDKKIWFTEIGCPGVRKVTPETNWWEGKSPRESQQARFVKVIYTDCIDLPDVDKIFWAFFRDNLDHFKSGVDYFGLIRWDFSRKSSYKAYRRSYLIWKKREYQKIYK